MFSIKAEKMLKQSLKLSAEYMEVFADWLKDEENQKRIIALIQDLVLRFREKLKELDKEK